jgi:hypothetical protein
MTRREALYGKGKSGAVPDADTEGKQAKVKLTGGSRAEDVHPNRKPPKLGAKE